MPTAPGPPPVAYGVAAPKPPLPLLRRVVTVFAVKLVVIKSRSPSASMSARASPVGSPPGTEVVMPKPPEPLLNIIVTPVPSLATAKSISPSLSTSPAISKYGLAPAAGVGVTGCGVYEPEPLLTRIDAVLAV